jgi:AsmA protein
MRAFKIIGIIFGSLVALVLLAAVAVLLLVDPNDHKDRISAAVQKSTGRALTLPGELKLSLFPWIASSLI